jgi:hypothetical protein
MSIFPPRRDKLEGSFGRRAAKERCARRSNSLFLMACIECIKKFRPRILGQLWWDAKVFVPQECDKDRTKSVTPDWGKNPRCNEQNSSSLRQEYFRRLGASSSGGCNRRRCVHTARETMLLSSASASELAPRDWRRPRRPPPLLSVATSPATAASKRPECVQHRPQERPV